MTLLVPWLCLWLPMKVSVLVILLWFKCWNHCFLNLGMQVSYPNYWNRPKKNLKFKSTMFFLVHPLLSLVCHCPTRPFSSTEPESNIQQMVVNAFYLLNKPPTRIDPKKQHTTTVPFLERHSKDGNVKHMFSFGERKGVWHPKILNTWRPGVGCFRVIFFGQSMPITSLWMMMMWACPQLNHRADQNNRFKGGWRGLLLSSARG